MLSSASEAKRHHFPDTADENAKPGLQSSHTITWWCLDLNDVLHVDVPVVVPFVYLTIPANPLVPTCTPSAFPVRVPNGSQFVAGGLAAWWMNKTYPPIIREALEESGYVFHGQSPPEDLMGKIDAIRIEVRTFVPGVPVAPGVGAFVAEFFFDPRQNFRRLQYSDLFGAFRATETPIVFPEVDVEFSVDELERLPLLVFPGIVGPVAPGSYRAFVWWHLNETHNDGIALLGGSFLYPGWLLYQAPRFIVTP